MVGVVKHQGTSALRDFNRRKEIRYDVDLPVQVYIDGFKAAVGSTTDISLSGIGLHLRSPLEVGKIYKVDIDKELALRVRIVSGRIGMRYGGLFEFSEWEQHRMTTKIRKLISVHSSETML
ncbi:PilZ domain-containing protein [Parvularcula marina]|uniref:PilZ domain-containing protein n=1 Tax=Parvularcula marina TaxID=2292771 RepID=UPI0035191300